MNDLTTLEQRWGAARIHAAMQALYIGDGDEPGDPPIAVVNASVNDQELWQNLTDEEREQLYMACLETQYDTAEITHALYDVLEPINGLQPTV
jgi:hypothetical protein